MFSDVVTEVVLVVSSRFCFISVKLHCMVFLVLAISAVLPDNKTKYDKQVVVLGCRIVDG